MRRILPAAIAAAVVLPCLTGVPAASATTGDPVLINAALISTTGTDPEYIELYGTPGTSLAGLSVIGVESNASAGSVVNGTIDHRYDLAPTATLGDNGYYLLGNTTAANTLGVTPNAGIPENGLENSSITIALVETASITGTTAADVGVVRDAIGVTDATAGNVFAFGAPVFGPDGTNLPAGVRRATAGVDTDSAADWLQLVFSPANAPLNLPTAGTFDQDPGDPEPVLISAVQGTGDASPLVGQQVTIEGIVVGDHEGASPALRGFFVQEEDGDADSDPATSEGIFVFNGSADTVSVGDAVRVTGTVTEFDDLTELTQTTTTVLSSDNPLPTPATLTFPVAAVSDIEATEGMAATLPQRLVVAEYFNFDRYGEIVVALPADGETFPMSPTAVFAPDDPAAAARAELNLRSRITVDDGITAQNVTVTHPITREPLTIDTMFRGGDAVTGLTGPVFQAFDLYRILPYAGDAGHDSYEETEGAPEPEPVGGSVTAAWLNALNYFTTLGATCGPTATEDCRGADDADELARQRAKLLNTLEGLDADVIGLGELENTTGVEVLADIVAGLNDRVGAGSYAYVAAGTGGVVGPDVIKVGLVYRPAALTPVGQTAVLDTMAFLDPNNTGEDRNRAAIAQSFRENATGEVFSVTVNHLKSKGSACGEPGEGGLVGSCDLTRTLAAGVLADWLATSPTGVADADWLILGDLNAYDHEAPIATFAARGYSDLVKEHHGDLAYSYVFDGQAGYLDYALASASIAGQVTGVGHWNINADEPDIIDYDTTFKSDAQDALFDPTTPYRSSDHDPVLVGLALRSGIAVKAAPDTLWLPLHQLQKIKLTAKGAKKVKYDVDALSGTSSEADSGLGRLDRPGDIVITDGDLRLRAERYSRKGRTYTVEVVAAGGGQVVYDTVTVRVPYLLPQLG